MTARKSLYLAILLALLLAPFGRQAVQAASNPEAAMAMARHCDPAPPAAPLPAHRGSIDCMIACAGVPVVEASLTAPPPPPLPPTVAEPVLALRGLLPQFDPPPPRSLS